MAEEVNAEEEDQPKGGCNVGMSMIRFPKAEGNKTPTECMRSHRATDSWEHFDQVSLEESGSNLWTPQDVRHTLAHVAMIHSQVEPWMRKAQFHLQSLGPSEVDGVPMGEKDIPPRSALREDSGFTTNSITCELAKASQCELMLDWQPLKVESWLCWRLPCFILHKRTKKDRKECANGHSQKPDIVSCG